MFIAKKYCSNAGFHTTKSMDGRYPKGLASRCKRLGNHRRHALQKLHNFTVNLYKITKDFADEEKFGLTN